MRLFKVEYDDGKPIDLDKQPAMKAARSKFCTPRGRAAGYYLCTEGTQEEIKIGYMRVSEMAGLESLINRAVHMPDADVAQLAEQPICNRQVGGSSPSVGSSLYEKGPIKLLPIHETHWAHARKHFTHPCPQYPMCCKGYAGGCICENNTDPKLFTKELSDRFDVLSAAARDYYSRAALKKSEPKPKWTFNCTTCEDKGGPWKKRVLLGWLEWWAKTRCTECGSESVGKP